jgi:hypothetical protein
MNQQRNDSRPVKVLASEDSIDIAVLEPLDIIRNIIKAQSPVKPQDLNHSEKAILKILHAALRQDSPHNTKEEYIYFFRELTNPSSGGHNLLWQMCLSGHSSGIRPLNDDSLDTSTGRTLTKAMKEDLMKLMVSLPIFWQSNTNWLKAKIDPLGTEWKRSLVLP